MAHPSTNTRQSQIQWSSVKPTTVTLEKLQLLTSTSQTLSREGYVLEPLSESEIWKKMRCVNCGQRLKTFLPPLGDNEKYGQANLVEITPPKFELYNWLRNPWRPSELRAGPAASVLRTTHACLYHSGRTYKGVWDCCGGRINTDGCCSNLTHYPCDLAEVRSQWAYHKTPPPHPLYQEAASAPKFSQRRINRYVNPFAPINSLSGTFPQTPNSIRAVVALDCEMGTPAIGTSLDRVLIRISLIDFFTQETLIDALVAPTVEMAHYNTRYSGVTFAAMRSAIHYGQAIMGLDAARESVQRFVDSNTIIIMHAGLNDLNTLRMIHPADKIIDTYILESYDQEVREKRLKKSLQDVCWRRCGIKVQDAKSNNGRQLGHDSLEDAFACREVVCVWLRGIPDE